MYHAVHMEVEETQVNSLLPRCGSWGLNSGCLVWQQVLLSISLVQSLLTQCLAYTPHDSSRLNVQSTGIINMYQFAWLGTKAVSHETLRDTASGQLVLLTD